MTDTKQQPTTSTPSTFRFTPQRGTCFFLGALFAQLVIFHHSFVTAFTAASVTLAMLVLVYSVVALVEKRIKSQK